MGRFPAILGPLPSPGAAGLALQSGLSHTARRPMFLKLATADAVIRLLVVEGWGWGCGECSEKLSLMALGYTP